MWVKKIDYYLTSSCLEYFIARKVRPVFEVYRIVFHHAAAQIQHQQSLQEQIQAKLAFADWSAKFLNLNEASKLGIAQKIGKMVGLDDALPQSVNAGTEKPITHAATDLLKSHNVGISAQAFNRMLELKGVVKHATRPGNRGKVHSWYVILQPLTSTVRISKTLNFSSRHRYVGMMLHLRNCSPSLA